MHLALGAGLAGGRPGRTSPAPGVPTLKRPPGLAGPGLAAGTARIGAELEVDPGDWTGAARLGFAWLRNGAPIPGATGARYTPLGADDRAALAARVTAFGAGGRAAAETPAVTIAYPPPRPVGAFPDLDLIQRTGPYIVDASPFFTGDSLVFGVTGEGVSIDPATGLLTISAAALRAGLAVQVTAANSGGAAVASFRLTVAAAALIAPSVIAGPSLAGAGRVGEPLVLEPGAWAGDPVPALALQWLCDGAPIEGATAARFTPGAAEDGGLVAARVTASNPAGAASAETAPIRVARAAPRATGALADLVLALGSGAFSLPAAPAFAGEALRFSVEGAGATVDPETGVVSIPLGTPRSGATVTVIAANSGGVARLGFSLRVIAAPTALAAPAPAVLAQGPGSKTIAAAAFFAGPELAYALEGAPAGVTIDARSGIVTVATAAALTATLTLRATNAAGTATQRLALSVRAGLAAPTALAAPAPVVFAQGPGSKTVPAAAFFAGAELVYALEGAPAGVTINVASGLITVATAAALTASVTLRATNAAGAATQSLGLRVLAAPTALAAPAPVVFAQGPGSKTVPAAAFFAGPELVYALEGAPTGVTINAGSGLVTVATTAALTASVTLRATNAAGAATQSLGLRVLAAPTALAAPAPVVFAQGSGVKTVAAAAFFTGPERVYALEGAPAGVTINAASGLVSVATTAALTASVTLRATNAAGAATQSLAISVRADVAPLANATLPAFTPRAAPGTTVGSVWDIGEGTWTGGVAPFVTERSVFRGAAQTVPFGAAASYTILGADQTTVANTITARVRRTDSSVPPQVVTVTATGSAVIPAQTGGGVAPADFTVSTVAQLRQAMIDAAGMQGPRVIVMEPGAYGALNLPANLRKVGLTPDGAGNRVTIRPRFRQTAATPANQRTQFLNGTWGPDPLAGLEGWTFDNIWWTDTRKDGVGKGWPSVNSKTMNLNDPKHLTWRNCRFAGQHRNIATHGRSENIVFEWCEFTLNGMDCFSLYDQAVNCHIRNNWWHDMDIDHSRSREATRHPDSGSMQGKNSRNCSYTGNFYEAEPGYWQGPFCPNATIRNGGAWAANYNDGLLIARNWLNMGNWNTILVGGWQNAVIEDNVIRAISGQSVKIVLEAQSRGICRRNVMQSAIEFGGGSTPAMWQGLDTNVVSATATPAALPRREPFGPFGYE